MIAWLMLSQAGNTFAGSAEDKTFTDLFRLRLLLRFLPARIFIDPFLEQRGHTLPALLCIWTES